MAYAAWSVIAGEQPTTSKWNILGSNDAAFNNGTGIANLEIGAVTAVKNDYKFSYTVSNGATSNSAAVVKFTTQVFDTGSNYSASTGLFTAPAAGIYFFEVSGYVGVSNSGVNANQTILYKNGSNYRTIDFNNSSGNTGQNLWVGGSALLSLALSDTIGVYMVNTFSTGMTGAFEGFLVSNT